MDTCAQTQTKTNTDVQRVAYFFLWCYTHMLQYPRKKLINVTELEMRRPDWTNYFRFIFLCFIFQMASSSTHRRLHTSSMHAKTKCPYSNELQWQHMMMSRCSKVFVHVCVFCVYMSALSLSLCFSRKQNQKDKCGLCCLWSTVIFIIFMGFFFCQLQKVKLKYIDLKDIKIRKPKHSISAVV